MGETNGTSSIPPWLNKTFIENILREDFKDKELKILHCEVTPATATGDNYGSQMLRFNLELQSKEKQKLSLIAKLLPPGMLGQRSDVQYAFQNEASGFTKTVPILYDILLRAYPTHERLSARCYHTQGPPNDVIILEDLKASGFKLADRFQGLDRAHADMVLKTLAKQHACSLLFSDDLKAETHDYCFWLHEDLIKPILKGPFQGLTRQLKTWPDFKRKEIILEKMENIQDIIPDKSFKLWRNDESKLNVLLHGDCWTNNFMFRYDSSGKVTGIRSVDLQLFSWNSPCLDLQYFIFSSISDDLKFDHIDEFLETYHSTFKETLQRLGHQLEVPFELNDLKKEFEKYYFWGFIIFCCIYPIIILPKSDPLNPDDYFTSDDGSKFDKMFSREVLREKLKQGLAFFEEKGAF